jgi:hypothetical protein
LPPPSAPYQWPRFNPNKKAAAPFPPVPPPTYKETEQEMDNDLYTDV